MPISIVNVESLEQTKDIASSNIEDIALSNNHQPSENNAEHVGVQQGVDEHMADEHANERAGNRGSRSSARRRLRASISLPGTSAEELNSYENMMHPRTNQLRSDQKIARLKNMARCRM